MIKIIVAWTAAGFNVCSEKVAKIRRHKNPGSSPRGAARNREERGCREKLEWSGQSAEGVGRIWMLSRSPERESSTLYLASPSSLL